MLEDAPFLRAILANPDDRLTRLVYADWLDDRADPRAEYLRLAVRAAEQPELRARMLELQPHLPYWWVAIAGGLRVASGDQRPGGSRIEECERVFGRAKHATDADGYKLELVAAATSGLHPAIAYLEQRSKSLASRYDDYYVLVLRDAAGRTVEWRPYVYSTYAEFDVHVLEWYGDAVLLVYREKHNTYIARFGFDGPARSHKIASWLLNGREIGFTGYRETEVRRLSVPDLDVLPALTPEQAAERDLMPKVPAWWLNG